MNILKAIPSAAGQALRGFSLTLLAVGCVGVPTAPDGAPTHPANSHAAASPLPPLQPGLLAVTNLVIIKPISEPAPEDEHEHEKPETKPQSKEKR